MFGKKIKSIRSSLGISQQRLADLIGVKQSVVAKYELDTRDPSPKVLFKLVELVKKHKLKINFLGE